MYHELFYTLFSQLAVGGLVCVLPVPESAGKRFFRFCGLLSIALLSIALWAAPAQTWANGVSPAAYLLAASLLISALFVYAAMAERERLKRVALSLAGMVGTVGIVLSALERTPPQSGHWVALLYTASALASALFLGSIIYAMILGHWYLVVPTLPNKPLETLAKLIVAATILKAVTTGITFLFFWYEGGPEVHPLLLRFLWFEDLFFTARVLFGLLGPGLLAYMIWETVRIHSTQSATGLLYVATVFVLIGEAFSHYLAYTTALPI
jgi:protein NrfD